MSKKAKEELNPIKTRKQKKISETKCFKKINKSNKTLIKKLNEDKRET